MITLLYPLSKLDIGRSAEIFWLSNHKNISTRLLDLGFEPGTQVTCVLKRGKDELSAFLVKGTVIALRREDSEIVLVADPPGSHSFSPDDGTSPNPVPKPDNSSLSEGGCL